MDGFIQGFILFPDMFLVENITTPILKRKR